MLLQYKTIGLITIMWTLLPFNTRANDSLVNEYQSNSISIKEINQDNWKKAIEGISYRDKIKPARKEKKIPKENNQDKERSTSSQNIRSNLATIVLILIVGGISFLLFRFALGKYIFPVTASTSSSGTVKATEIAQLEEDLNLYDPSQLIEKAIFAQDYRLAIRLYYLKTLRQLSLKRVIEWEKRKTNYDYLQELSFSSLKHDFEQLTQVYERTWYGNQQLGKYEFQQIQPQFDYLVSKINLTILNS